MGFLRYFYGRIFHCHEEETHLPRALPRPKARPSLDQNNACSFFLSIFMFILIWKMIVPLNVSGLQELQEDVRTALFLEQ